MQLTKKKSEFDYKKTEQTLITENTFINDLFSVLCMPQRLDDSEEDEDDDGQQPHKKKNPKQNTTRAKSLVELQQRLEAITSKKKLTYKEKMVKKGLKNRMKKKSKADERNAQQKLIRAQKATTTKTEFKKENDTDDIKPNKKSAKPVYNSEGKLVFSKFDFSELGGSSNATKKIEKDPKKLLQKLEEQKNIIAKLEESGDIEKAVEIKEKTAWKNALAKAEGHKVRDDPMLLKKSVQKQEQLKRSSKKKWQTRQEGVKKAQEEKQRKRTDNIQKRKKEKKVGKLKKAAKRGKIIPGF